jgi:hypothetical protein
MCYCGMGGAMRRATWCCGMGASNGGVTVRFTSAAAAYRRWTTRAGVSPATDVPSASTMAEAMFTPTVAIAPVRPWTHAQENAVVEIARSIVTTGRAGIRRIAVVPVRTDGLIDADDNFRADLWRQGQDSEQGCCTGQEQTAHYELVSPERHILDLQHSVTSDVPLSISSIRPWLKDS